MPDRTEAGGVTLNQSMDDLTAYKEFVLDIEAEVEAAAHHCQQATDQNYELRITLLGLRNCLARLEERLHEDGQADA